MSRAIEIFNQNILIEETDHIAEDLAARADLENRKIYLDKSANKKDEKSNIFHEAIHMSLMIGGISYLIDEKLEEAIVRCIEHGLSNSIELKIKKL